jgi:hypothetical protein
LFFLPSSLASLGTPTKSQDQKIAACGSSYRIAYGCNFTGVSVGVGAGEACDLLAILEIAR